MCGYREVKQGRKKPPPPPPSPSNQGFEFHLLIDASISYIFNNCTKSLRIAITYMKEGMKSYPDYLSRRVTFPVADLGLLKGGVIDAPRRQIPLPPFTRNQL